MIAHKDFFRVSHPKVLMLEIQLLSHNLWTKFVKFQPQCMDRQAKLNKRVKRLSRYCWKGWQRIGQFTRDLSYFLRLLSWSLGRRTGPHWGCGGSGYSRDCLKYRSSRCWGRCGRSPGRCGRCPGRSDRSPDRCGWLNRLSNWDRLGHWSSWFRKGRRKSNGSTRRTNGILKRRLEYNIKN